MQVYQYMEYPFPAFTGRGLGSQILQYLESWSPVVGWDQPNNPCAGLLQCKATSIWRHRHKVVAAPWAELV